MDFVYDRPSSGSSCLSAQEPPTKSTHMNHLQPPKTSFKLNNNSPLPTSSPEPSRKRMHYDTESMDWESCPAAQPDPKPNLFPNPDSTRVLGGTFLFNPPSSLPLPPVYTHPSSTLPSSLPSPTKLGPQSYGLYATPRNTYSEDHEADSSLDVEHVQLPPNHSSKMYSSNAVKHENRRRTRAQKQVRSKLSQLSFHSDHDDDDNDSDVQVINNHENKTLTKKSNHSKNRQDRVLKKKRSETTTNNYLTINGWKGPEGTTNQQKNHSHLSSDTPYILLGYLQLLFNSSLAFVGLYLVINLILIIRTDINHKVMVHTGRLRQEIDICIKEYNSNRCFPVEQRTKFIEKHCIEWESCMNRDPKLISRSKIGAETFAEVMNGFVDVISWKTMLFIFLSIGASIYAINLAMNNFKSKWEPQHQHQRASPWKSRLISTRLDDTKQSNHESFASSSSMDPIEIFGYNSKNFSNNKSSDARKNR